MAWIWNSHGRLYTSHATEMRLTILNQISRRCDLSSARVYLRKHMRGTSWICAQHNIMMTGTYIYVSLWSLHINTVKKHTKAPPWRAHTHTMHARAHTHAPSVSHTQMLLKDARIELDFMSHATRLRRVCRELLSIQSAYLSAHAKVHTYVRTYIHTYIYIHVCAESFSRFKAPILEIVYHIHT